MKHTIIILSILGLTQLVGCAYGTRYTELPYPPKKQVELSPAEAQPVKVGPRNRYVLLAVNDTRETSDRIGNVRDNFGFDTASILTEDNVAVWVHNAFSFELDRLGYQVLAPYGVSPDGASDRLTVNVQKVYCDIYMVYDGEVSLQAVLQPAGQEPVSADYPAKVSSGLSWGGTGTATGESLAQAMQTSIRSMLRDFGYAD